MIARSIIQRAFAEVVQSKYEASASELQDGLRYMNRMMARLESEGVEVNYTSLSSLDDELTSPMTTIMGIVKNLAVSLWPQYNSKPLNPALKFWADRALNSMRIQAIDGLSASQFPATLPVGSGNYQGLYHEDFYTNDRGMGYYIATEEDSNGQ